MDLYLHIRLSDGGIMTTEPSLPEIQKKWHGTLKAYIIGFTGSLLLTFISFSLVITRPFPKVGILFTIVALALTQAIVQLLCFLHVGQEEKPRWETFIFCLMVVILLIVAGGTLWIMHDLNERMMSEMTM